MALTNSSKNIFGQTLVVALIIMSLGLVLGVGFLGYSRIVYNIVKSQSDALQGYYLGNTGIEVAWSKLSKDFEGYKIQTINFVDGSKVVISVDAVTTDSLGRKIREVTSTATNGKTVNKIKKRFMLTITYVDTLWSNSSNSIIKFDTATGIKTTYNSGASNLSCWSVNPATNKVWSGDRSAGNTRIYRLDIDTGKTSPMGANSVGGHMLIPMGNAIDNSTNQCWFVSNFAPDEIMQYDCNNDKLIKKVSFGPVSLNDILINQVTHEIWVLGSYSTPIYRLNASGGNQLTIPVLNTYSFAIDNKNNICWAGISNAIKKYSGATGGLLATVSGVSYPKNMDVDPGTGDLWVSDYSQNKVKKIGYTSGSVSLTVDVNKPEGIAVSQIGAGKCWVISSTDKAIYEIDTSTGNKRLFASVSNIYKLRAVGSNASTTVTLVD